ncbi:hypothetical protein D6764_03270 [Candidatus Woesearchaeota archaeon]|nr:MAG: hypothetical protein D6764_03270 [Candidatus Woesearchaeota archaeon]
MALSEKMEDQLRKMPVIESRVFKSKDGRFLVHKTVITDIKPLTYYEAVIENEPREDAEEVKEEAVEA